MPVIFPRYQPCTWRGRIRGSETMNDQELVDQLLQRQESNELDFKSEQYRFYTDHLKSQFIKDIVSMANTIRSGSAYILLGVKGRLNLDHEVKGLPHHHDEAQFTRHSAIQGCTDTQIHLSADTLRRPPIGNFRNLPRAAGCGHSTSRLWRSQKRGGVHSEKFNELRGRKR